jgi:hypothetical protein
MVHQMKYIKACDGIKSLIVCDAAMLNKFVKF